MLRRVKYFNNFRQLVTFLNSNLIHLNISFFSFICLKAPEHCLAQREKHTVEPALEPCRAWGIITVLHIHTRCVVHEELGHAPWPTFLRFVVFVFFPLPTFIWAGPALAGWAELSSATGVGEERFARFEAESPSAAKQLDAPSQHVDKQSIHTRVTAEQSVSQREICACRHNELIQKDAPVGLYILL